MVRTMYALEWTLDHFFTPFGSNRLFQLFVIHSRPLPISVLGSARPASADVLWIMEVDLEKAAARITHKVQELCKKKSVNDHFNLFSFFFSHFTLEYIER
ncbi:hypothetical protein CRYUN_Cryun40dG0015400 [Craigia yunnanensis]